jgi:5-methylcytosine-specific restriction enzyme subunit McrC
MLYAGDLAPILNRSNKGYDEDRDNLPNLIAEFLSFIVEKRLQRNLSFGYQSRHEELSRVRGKIDFLSTERGQLLSKGKIACHFEELTINTPRNRFVLAALEKVSTLVIDNPKLAHQCRVLATRFKRLGVSEIIPSKAEISSIQISRNDAEDKAMIAAAKLVFNYKLPNQNYDKQFMFTPERDDVWLRNLFERAVRGFYKYMLKDEWKVNDKRKLNWKIDYQDEGINAILPNMETDIILDNHELNQRIIIDTKFTSIFKENQFGDEKLKSGYIYQMYAYLMSQSDNEDPLEKNASGVLLHPTVDKSVDQTVKIQGHSIRFLTINLNESTSKIKEMLLDVINKPILIH